MGTLPISPWAVGSFFVSIFGYIALNTVLQVVYYQRGADRVDEWKAQPRRKGGVGQLHWWLPLLRLPPGTHKERAPDHAFVCMVNLVVVSTMIAATVDLTFRGSTRLYFTDPHSCTTAETHTHTHMGVLASECVSLILALAWQSVVEYYWHRAMHLPFFYKTFHKMHHRYKSPEPFDDMYMHPVEVFGYYCILFSPAFIVPMHVGTFVAYIVLLGFFAIYDHSGIKLGIPYLYHSMAHDIHHSHFDCNYAFPFPFLDIVHNTFTGTYGGYEFHAWRVRKPVREHTPTRAPAPTPMSTPQHSSSSSEEDVSCSRSCDGGAGGSSSSSGERGENGGPSGTAVIHADSRSCSPDTFVPGGHMYGTELHDVGSGRKVAFDIPLEDTEDVLRAPPAGPIPQRR